MDNTNEEETKETDPVILTPEFLKGWDEMILILKKPPYQT